MKKKNKEKCRKILKFLEQYNNSWFDVKSIGKELGMSKTRIYSGLKILEYYDGVEVNRGGSIYLFRFLRTVDDDDFETERFNDNIDNHLINVEAEKKYININETDERLSKLVEKILVYKQGKRYEVGSIKFYELVKVLKLILNGELNMEEILNGEN